ncbi:hypothetical protein [Zavarzinella formosa]|uniref:hypothetical protein n=1 Tax=Zavarzinella formosa TaxID=360055 RepID=UPI0002ECAAC3|nr:hypothetical protein [Zavarzinella formosa]
MIRAVLLCLGFTFALLVSTTSGATPVELLPLVPDDYSFCLVGHRATTALSSPADSKFAKAFWQSPLVKEAASSPDIARLLTVKDQLVRELGVKDPELLELAFGGTVLLTYRKPAEGKPETEAGLLILHTEQGKKLRESVDHINQLQIKGGELRAIEEVKHPTPYWKRAKSDSTASPEYFWIEDGLLIFTSNETLLRETLARRKSPPAKSLAATQLKALGLEEAPLCLLMNPRSFDREVEAGVNAGKPGERTVLDLFGKTWKAIDQIGLHLSRKPDLTIGLTVGCEMERLPLAVKALVAGFNQPLRSWDRLPENALFALVLPFQTSKLDGFLKSVVPEGDHRKMREAVLSAVRPLGEDIEWDALLNTFGPEIAVWGSPPDAKHPGLDPSVGVAIPLELKHAEASAKMLSEGIDFLIRLLCLSDSGYRVSTVKGEGFSIKKLSHPDFPAGVEPCYAIRSGTLLMASHPRMIEQYSPVARESKPRAVNPLIRLSGPTWGEHLVKAAPRMASKMSADPKEQERMTRLLKGLAPVVAELDRIEFNLTTEKNRARLQLQFIEQPARPVK